MDRLKASNEKINLLVDENLQLCSALLLWSKWIIVLRNDRKENEISTVVRFKFEQQKKFDLLQIICDICCQ